MSSPRGRAAPGRAERRDGRRRSASIPWRRGRAGEVESERVSSRGGRERVEAGDWRGERWRSSRRGLAAGGRGWMDPWGCQVTALSPQAADFSRYSAPYRCPAGCYPCPLAVSLFPRRSPSPAAIGRPGGAAPFASFESAAGVHGHEITGVYQQPRTRIISVFGTCVRIRTVGEETFGATCRRL